MGKTIIKSGNLTGLEVGSFVTFDEEAHSTDAYKGGAKFAVTEVDMTNGTLLN